MTFNGCANRGSIVKCFYFAKNTTKGGEDVYDYEEHKDDTGIYMIKCLCNGMVYVGATSTSFKYRKQDHMSKLKNGKHQKKLQMV